MQRIKPMLARLGIESDLKQGEMFYEPKLDGIRAIVSVNGASHQIQARSGTDKTHLFPELRIETKLPAILDGEIISGSSFNNIQHRANRINGIVGAVKDYPANYVVFDVLEMNGTNLRRMPLEQRKQLLAGLVVPTSNCDIITYTERGNELFEAIRASGGEGVIGKAKRGFYLEDKREWFKVKCWKTEEFMVVGYTAGTGWRASTFGALALMDAKGKYVGEVGTGFNENDIASIMAMFSQCSCPITTPFHESEPIIWVKPFAVKVQYQEITNDGKLRFPSFKGVGG